jgi:hypothetical protein
LQLLELIAEAAGLDGSTWGVGLGKKEEHDRLAAKVFEAYRLAILIGYRCVGNLIANFHEGLFLEVSF